jgi:hypothetical protein
MEYDALVWNYLSICLSRIFSLSFKIVYSGLETFWQSAFCWFFRPFVSAHGHLWTLEPTELPPLSVEWPWHSTSFSAKVRFQCKVIPFSSNRLNWAFCNLDWNCRYSALEDGRRWRGRSHFGFASVAKATRSCVKRCSNYLVKNVASAASQTRSMR